MLLLVLVALATHRVTRLITRDAFPLVAIPRERFVNRWAIENDPEPGSGLLSINGKKTNRFMESIAYLWECDWCASIYVAAGLTFAVHQLSPLGDQPWIYSVLIWLTASTVTGLIAANEPD